MDAFRKLQPEPATTTPHSPRNHALNLMLATVTTALTPPASATPSEATLPPSPATANEPPAAAATAVKPSEKPVVLNGASFLNIIPAQANGLQFGVNFGIVVSPDAAAHSYFTLCHLVGALMDVTPQGILGHSRAQHLTMARHLTMYLAFHYFNYTHSAIGRFHNKDHTAIMHAEKHIRTELGSGSVIAPYLKVIVKSVEAALKERVQFSRPLSMKNIIAMCVETANRWIADAPNAPHDPPTPLTVETALNIKKRLPATLMARRYIVEMGRRVWGFSFPDLATYFISTGSPPNHSTFVTMHTKLREAMITDLDLRDDLDTLERRIRARTHLVILDPSLVLCRQPKGRTH